MLNQLPCRSLAYLRLASLLSITLVVEMAALAAQSGPSAAQKAQSASAPAAASSKAPDFSKEAAVIDKLYTRYREESDGTGTRQTSARVRVLADAGVKQLAILTFTYTASNEQVDIAYVRVTKPDGSVVVTPDYNIQDLPADVTREAPMYSDIHQKHVAVRGLGVGDTLEYQVTFRTTKPEVPDQFWFEYNFDKDDILLDEQLDVDIPVQKQVTVASAEVQPTVQTEGDRKVYHWASSNLAHPDPDGPPKSVKHWKPSVQVTTFSSWAQIGAWYASLQKDSVVVTPAIQARVAGLTQGLSTNDEKIRAIFNDVALHIHYVALEFGIGRYQPHSADDVLANQYGDCKDKHTLLAAMLKAAGIDSWPVLISTSRPLDPGAPSPGQFNHVITVIPNGDKLLWMDSTEEVAPVGVIAGSLRDKQALAIPLNKAAYLETTPADLPFRQSAQFNVTGKLAEDGTLTAKIEQNYHGDGELVMRSAIRGVPQAQWKLFTQRMSNLLGFAGEVADPTISPIEQINQPLQISYGYTREKFGDWDVHRISPPLPPFGVELGPGMKQTKPADDIDLGSPGESVYSAKVQLPEGSQIYPPSSTDVSNDWAEYHAKYSFKDGAFLAERHLVVKKDKVPLSDWDKYLAFRRAIYDDENLEVTVLMEKDSDSDTDHVELNLRPGQERTELPAANSPLRDAVNSLSADAPPSAEALSKTVATIDAEVQTAETKSATLPADDFQSLYWGQTLSSVWCVRGWAALLSKDLPAAESYLRASWRLSSDRVSGYLLGEVLLAEGNKSAAAHMFQLADATGANELPGATLAYANSVGKRIAESYRSATGKSLTSTALNHGAYDGSLLQEIDLQSEIKGFVRTTKLTGTGLFAVAFEQGKQPEATMLTGDKGFESLIPLIRAHSFPVQLPQGSKARLLREVRIVCSPWAGCDAWLVRSGSIERPMRMVRAVQVAAPSAPKVVKAAN